MNPLYKSLISQVENKMAGYIALLSFRYQNLCVKADAASLMPVNVMMGGEPKNIEDVAKVGVTDDYHLAVFPNQEGLQPFVTDGIFRSHPEFKLEVKTYKLNDEDRHFLYYEMPEVDSNRHDILEQGVNSLHNECKAKLDEIHVENVASLTGMLKGSAKDLETVCKELDRVHDDYVEKAKGVRDKKLEEIEEAFQRYQEAHSSENGGDEDNNDQADSGYNVTLGMRMGSEE